MIPTSIENKDFRYRRPSGMNIIEFLNALNDLLNGFADLTKTRRDSITHNFGILVEIAIRIDQRMDYFQYFHSSPQKCVVMSQTKRLALLAYWIIRYKPFTQPINNAEMCFAKNRCTINELIALFILKINVISASNLDRDKALRFLYTLEVERNIIHSFMHGDTTKESMIVLFDSLERALSAQ